jgi:hypothetical protein
LQTDGENETLGILERRHNLGTESERGKENEKLLEKKFQVQEPGNVQNEMTGQTNKKDT